MIPGGIMPPNMPMMPLKDGAVANPPYYPYPYMYPNPYMMYPYPPYPGAHIEESNTNRSREKSAEKSVSSGKSKKTL